uniref:Uncharacterized protein n=1 Tax=Romanomermis culicivorax TaxID=13658 RepID=A0A915IW88_ROMCU
MSNQRGTTQHPSATPSNKIQCLQSEMARLMAHIARLTAQQMAPPRRNLMLSTTPWAHVQNAGDCPSGAHLQMCSYNGSCTYNEASCRAQHSNRAGPSNAAATGVGCCYFC